MKFLAIILLTPILIFCTTTIESGPKLDELLLKSGKIRHEGIKGFIIHSTVHDEVPLFTEKSLEDQEIQHQVGKGRWVPYSVYMKDINEYDKQIIDLKNQIAKTTEIVGNLTEHSSTVKGILDTTTRILEALAALIAFIGAVFGTVHFSKKKTPKLSLRPALISKEDLDADVDRIIEKLKRFKSN
jgi:hypothetical protein